MENNIGKEKKKAILLLGIMGCLILLTIGFFLLDALESKKEYEKFNKYLQNPETTVFYIGKENCSYCKMYELVLDSIHNEYGVDFGYIDMEKLSSSELNSVLDTIGVEKEKFGTPTTVITKNGEVLKSHVGYLLREDLFEMLKEVGLIPASAELTEEFPEITKTSYEEYESLIHGKERVFLAIGQTYCMHCIEAKPSLNEIAKEYGIKVYYLNYTDISEEERAAFNRSLPYFIENEKWGTPLFLIVEDGELVDVTSGFSTKEKLVEFLKKNLMIN